MKLFTPDEQLHVNFLDVKVEVIIYQINNIFNTVNISILFKDEQNIKGGFYVSVLNLKTGTCKLRELLPFENIFFMNKMSEKLHIYK